MEGGIFSFYPQYDKNLIMKIALWGEKRLLFLCSFLTSISKPYADRAKKCLGEYARQNYSLWEKNQISTTARLSPPVITVGISKNICPVLSFEYTCLYLESSSTLLAVLYTHIWLWIQNSIINYKRPLNSFACPHKSRWKNIWQLSNFLGKGTVCLCSCQNRKPVKFALQTPLYLPRCHISEWI